MDSLREERIQVCVVDFGVHGLGHQAQVLQLALSNIVGDGGEELGRQIRKTAV